MRMEEEEWRSRRGRQTHGRSGRLKVGDLEGTQKDNMRVLNMK
jgi:hypothetical protein